MRTQTQNERIAEWLRSGKSITPLDALRQFGCFRLGARIWDLKHKGMKIKTEIIRHNDTRFASYTLCR